MKNLCLLLILIPSLCFSQTFPQGSFAENRVDEATHDTIMRTYWQVMERSGLSRKLNTFYRISRINDNIYIDLKVIEAGRPFVVPRGAELKILLENGNILLFHNKSYQVSCAGCGARGFAGSSVQGAVLSFEVTDYNMRQLMHHYIARIGINTGDDYLEKRITVEHSEVFMSELRMVRDAAAW